jgi:hypothetical protein
VPVLHRACLADAKPSSAAASSSAAPAAAPAAAASGSSSGGSFPAHDVMKMPALSPTMSHGNIVSWNKKVGQHSPWATLDDVFGIGTQSFTASCLQSV